MAHQRTTMIYDCVHFFNELDLLEIRLTELDSLVDIFVIAEATRTMRGNPKELNFLDNQARFKRWHDRIRYVAVKDMPEGDDHRAREDHQRGSTMQGLKDARPNDTILSSDLDEIPGARAILGWKEARGPEVMRMKMSYYWVNCIHASQWNGTRIMSYSQLKHIGNTAAARKIYLQKRIRRAGWHFSSLGGVEAVMTKLRSFCHWEFDTPEVNNYDNIHRVVHEGMDIYGQKNQLLKFVPLDGSFPKTILNNQEKYAHLIKPIDKVTH